MPVTNKGLGWDSLLEMVHNPGGDWHPGWGVDPILYIIISCYNIMPPLIFLQSGKQSTSLHAGLPTCFCPNFSPDVEGGKN